jgi:pyruvate dehydrogenase E1 component alpha subunit
VNFKNMNHLEIMAAGRYCSVDLNGTDPQFVKTLLSQMLRLRRMEEALMREYHPANEMRCPVHFCIGQEAAPAALSQVVQTGDYVFSHHRSHGYYFAKGSPLGEIFAELYGRETGASGGRAGSQDISHAGTRFFSGAILAGATSIGIGTAFGLQLQKLPQIVFCGFGEACTEEGAFWEGVNLAAAKKLPLVLVCENNRYSTFSDAHRRLAVTNLSTKVATFGIHTTQVFGNDVILVHRALREAAERARRGEGTTFVEAFTYRWCSHVGPEDDGVNNYRTREEIDFWKKNCPLDLLREKLEASGSLTRSDWDRMEAEVAREIEANFRFAKQSAFPQPTGWEGMNLRADSPVADRLLGAGQEHDFDPTQADASLTSY